MDSETPILDPASKMKKLVESSHNIEIDRNIPIARYFKSSRELVKSAVNHQELGDIEKAFVLYLRHMSLILEKLPSHPEWNKADKDEVAHAKKQCNIIFDLAEKLKAEIKEKYQNEYEAAIKVKCLKTKDKMVLNNEPNPTKELDALEDIDKKFNFKREAPNEEVRVLDDLFDLDKLRESLSSTK